MHNNPSQPACDKLVVAWCLFWGAFSAFLCGTAAHAIGPTYDEQFYVQAGMKNWRDWNHRELLTQGAMPLPAEVQTLPLRVAEVFRSEDPSEQWLAWLPTARLGTIVFLWLLLWAAYRLGTLYAGAPGGCWAVMLTSCEPIILGHGSLATTDLPFTACLLALMAVFRARRAEATWPRRLLLPVVFVAVAFLAKASALLFVPMTLGMLELERLWQAGWRPARSLQAWKPALLSLRDLSILAAMGIGLLFVVCPRASRGLLFQIKYNAQGSWTTFLLEETSTGFWYYFPAALVIKLGLPILILLLLTLILRPRWWLNGPMLAALGLLALTPSFRLQIGVRHVLPIAALAIVGASIAVARWWAEHKSGPRRVMVGGFASMLALWSFANAVQVWPNGTCYTNELFGGTSRGYLALSDSNYDWGQGLPELTIWQENHADAPLHLWYFGTDPGAQRPPFYPVSPAANSGAAELERMCAGGYLAVGTSHVFGAYFNTPVGRHLRTLSPCARTTTFLIYDFRHANAPAER